MAWQILMTIINFQCRDVNILKISLTALICLKTSGGQLANMLHSGCERILNDIAQWWFSKGDMSLYRIAISVRAFIWYLKIHQIHPCSSIHDIIIKITIISRRINLLRVIESRMIEIMANAGRDEYTKIFFGQMFVQFAGVDQNIHHLCDAKAVPEVVERIVSVVLLYP